MSKEKIYEFYLQYNLKFELFSYLFWPLLVTYMALIILPTEEILKTFLICFLFSAVPLSLILALLLGKANFLPLLVRFSNFLENSTNSEEISQLHKDLLDYPIIEARLNVVRWIVGVIVYNISNYFLRGFDLPTITIGFFILGYMLPFQYIFSYLYVENEISKLLSYPIFLNNKLSLKENEIFSYTKKLVLALLSIFLIPTLALSYVIFIPPFFKIQIPFFEYHLIIIIFIMTLYVIVFSIILARAFTKHITYLSFQMTNMSGGNFNSAIIISSNDESGILGNSLRNITSKIVNIIFSIQTLVKKISNSNETAQVEFQKLKNTSSEQVRAVKDIQKILNTIQVSSHQMRSSLENQNSVTLVLQEQLTSMQTFISEVKNTEEIVIKNNLEIWNKFQNTKTQSLHSLESLNTVQGSFEKIQEIFF